MKAKVSIDRMKELKTEELQVLKKALQKSTKENRAQVEVIDKVLHSRNMKAMAAKRTADFLKNNDVQE